MAPRTAKAKKTADVKVSETDVPKKGRGKAKNVAEPDLETETEEKIQVADKEVKKNKRGKNIINYNEDKEDVAPPVKKGRKKNVDPVVNDDEIASINGDNSAEEGTASPADELEGIEDQSESNGSEENKAPASKGRKKTSKKEAKEVKPKETGRGRKNAKQDVDADTGIKEEVVEEKPKGRGGRGRKAQTKPEPESDPEEVETKVPPPGKGKKKAQQKTAPEKELDNEDEDLSAENKDIDEEKPEEEPKKKETKGRKNAGKKAQPKDVSEEKGDDIKEEAPISKKKKGAKKEEKGKGDAKEEIEEEEDSLPDEKPVKGKRGQKKAVEKYEDTEEVQDTGEPATKRRRKADEKVAEDSKKKVTKAATDYESIDFSNKSKNSQGKEWNLKVASWNVDGIRAWMGKGGLDYLKYERPNILCLQETKCSDDKLPEDIKNVPGYHAYWLCSDKDGYAGVNIYTTKLAMNVQYGLQNEELDSEGRIITAEYEQFYLICTYVPNAGRKLVTLDKRLKWNEKFRKYVKDLDSNKPVIICGDMNVAHNEIDLTNPKTNKKNAGFTAEERAGMTELLGDGFVDTFRHFYPDKTGAYTFWSNMFNSRAKNVGWRLDYFIVSERLVPALCDSVIRDKVYGSDHCPISLFLNLSSAEKPKE